ncbi:DUF4174 domain-containing protein [Geminicoccus harenae]|uniref:DUF4174 domain-containing protein n=1 Tax=Geminicoccus harenae TaxID=2498453 RepID=UPI00168A98B1|nr:DUF4174 domain-containing protein [Geminicoccus harenae]
MQVTRSLAVLVSLLVATLATGAAAMEPLDSYRWQNRVLVLFARSGDPQLQAQRDELLPVRDQLDERDLVIFAVIDGRRIEPVHGQAPADDQAAPLLAAFDLPADAGFTALLVGKDGGVKWQANRPARQGELFGLIDAMPMRRNER